jgi:hypothetical protein
LIHACGFIDSDLVVYLRRADDDPAPSPRAETEPLA